MLDQKVEQTLQKSLRVVGLNPPLSGYLTHRRVTPIADPLGDEFILFGRLTPQFGTYWIADLRQIALLYFEVPVHPVLGEDLPLRIVQHSFSPQIVKQGGNPVSEIFSRHTHGVSIFLYPWQRCVQSLIIHLHPAPGFKTNGLPRREGDFP